MTPNPLWLAIAAVPLAAWTTSQLQTCAPPTELVLAAVANGVIGLTASLRLQGVRAHAAALFGLLALSALPVARALAVPGLPFTHDLSVHAWSVYAVARALLAGEWLPLWSEVLGMGLPAPGLYPPLPWLMGGLLVVGGLSVSQALLGLAWLSGVLGMATTAAVLADQRLPRPAVLLGAVAFLLAPYRLLDLGYRFALAEMFGIALVLPCWHLLLQTVRGQTGPVFRRPATALAICASALVLTHPLSLILAVWGGLPLLGLALYSHRPSLRSLAPLALAVALTTGLTAFHTLPALTALPQTQAHTQMPASLFAEHALHPTQALRRQRWSGRRLSVGLQQEASSPEPVEEPPFYLGLVLFLPVGLSLLTRSEARPWALAALLCCVATWPGPAAWLQHLPALPAVQFPWRLLGPASLAAVVVFARVAATASPPVFVLALLALSWDAFPAFGAGSWTSWPQDGLAQQHGTSPPPTCAGETGRVGLASVPFNMQASSTGSLPSHAAAPRLQGAPWAGHPTGDLPPRVNGLWLPPQLPSLALGGFLPTPAEFWTAATSRLYRGPVSASDPLALARAGITHDLTASATWAPWPRVRLQTEGAWWGLTAEVRRRSPSRIELRLPPSLPAGTLVFAEQAFDGWTVAVDDAEEVPATAHEGLLSTPLPPLAARVVFRYRWTPARHLGTWVSLLTLLLFGALELRRLHTAREPSP